MREEMERTLRATPSQTSRARRAKYVEGRSNGGRSGKKCGTKSSIARTDAGVEGKGASQARMAALEAASSCCTFLIMSVFSCLFDIAYDENFLLSKNDFSQLEREIGR
mmetsp:Transcript_15160/g.51137  ORF Transcript_15160/g.51137 Transcript_15160/m.51137 type:complete len:108 (+) Transcript_15160:251-574(+)